eukprot:m.76249 g.76249  ORF g.76249 m.76249 type:complete len:87 (+) comp24879_c1_seq1:1754-2014(+)
MFATLASLFVPQYLGSSHDFHDSSRSNSTDQKTAPLKKKQYKSPTNKQCGCDRELILLAYYRQMKSDVIAKGVHCLLFPLFLGFVC